MANVVFELFAKLGLDSSEYTTGLGQAKTEAHSVMDTISQGFKTAAKIGAAALGAATTAVGTLGLQAVKSYSNYEQLVGGIETLFGTQGMTIQQYADKQGKAIDEVRDDYQMLSATEKAVIWDSNQAWKTAGMSNTEYMETVSGFAAALKQSCDTVEDAGEAANVAVRDMSDNSAKMGTSMESIKTAYAGFAKQNYTMLDNLKLGYGGTKEEMNRLLADAEKLTGVKYDISNLSDVYDAIHVIQDDLGITGTTAKEAMFTIEGSANATKAAWQNVVTAIAGGGDLQGAFDGLIESVFGGEEGGGLLNNIIPVIETTMEGIGSFIVSAAPYITEKIPELIAAILPDMVSAGLELVSTVGQTIINTVPVLIGSISSEIDSAISNSSFGSAWDSIKTSISTAIDGIKTSFNTLVTALSPITTAVGGVVEKFKEWIESGDALNEATELFNTGIELISGAISLLIEGLASVVDYGVQFAEWLTSGSDGADVFLAVLTGIATAVGLVTASMTAHAIAAGAYQVAMMAVEGVTNLVAGAQAALNAVMAANPIGIIVVAIAALVAGITYLWNTSEGFRTFVSNLFQFVTDAITATVNFFAELPGKIASFLGTIISNVASWGGNLISSMGSAASKAITAVVNFFVSLPGKIASFLGNIISNVVSWAANLISNMSNGASNAINAVINFFTGLPGQIASFFATIISNVSAWAGNLLSGMSDAASAAIDAVITFFTDLPGKIWDFLVKIVTDIGTWGGNMLKSATDAVSDVIKGIVDAFKDLPSKMLDIGKNLIKGLWNGITSVTDWIIEKIGGFTNSVLKAIKGFFGIASPSKVMRDQVGKFLALGIETGFEQNLDGERMANVAGKAVEKVQKALDPLSEPLGTLDASAMVKSSIEDLTVKAEGNTDRERLIDELAALMADQNAKLGEILDLLGEGVELNYNKRQLGRLVKEVAYV